MNIGNRIELEDMLGSYPSEYTPNFQTLISAKKEFIDSKSIKGEKVGDNGKLYMNHQIYYHRYFREYPGLLICDEAGTGKTCTVTGFTEYCIQEMEKSKKKEKADEKVAHFKRVIILVKGKTQKTEIKSQLLCKCSNSKYMSELVLSSKNEFSQKRNITNELTRAGYKIMTYGAFANLVKSYSNDDVGNRALNNDYSDTILWVDEGHNISLDINSINIYKSKQATYNEIWRFCHVVERIKKFITTATPMINDQSELASLLNIILPENGKIPENYDYRKSTKKDINTFFPKLPNTVDYKKALPSQMGKYFVGQIPLDTDFSKMTLEDIEPLMRGRVGYIRATESMAMPVYRGEKQTDKYVIEEQSGKSSENSETYESQLILETVEMSKEQSDIYHASMDAEYGATDEVFSAQRQAATFIYPDGYWGNGITQQEKSKKKEKKRLEKIGKDKAVDVDITQLVTDEEEGEKRAFKKYVIEKGDTFQATPELKEWISNKEYIATLSTKFARMMDIINKSKGVTFIYFPFVKGSGAIVFGLCLEHCLKFSQYKESKSVFMSKGSSMEKPVPCTNKEGGRKIKPTFTEANRYALLSRYTTDAQTQSMLEVSTSNENVYGQYIKVFITSKIGVEGINVLNVTDIIIAGPEWNIPKMYQAESRGIRVSSQEELLKQLRKKLIEQGKDPSKATIDINIHYMTSVSNEGHSIDKYMYTVAEAKNRSVKKLLRFLKQCSIGCQIHYDRNMRDNEIDYSQSCDYDVCKYSCVDPVPDQVDTTTYDVYYSDLIVQKLTKDIENVFRQHNTLGIQQLRATLSSLAPHESDFNIYNYKYIIMALEDIIKHKKRLYDRYGFPVYLNENNGIYYTSRNYPNISRRYSLYNGNSSMSYYTDSIIAVNGKTLANVISHLDWPKTEELIEQLKSLKAGSSRFMDFFEALSLEGKAISLEDALYKRANGDKLSNYDNFVINKFKYYWFEFNRPTKDIIDAKIISDPNTKKRGRKRTLETKKRLVRVGKDELDTTNDEEGTKVYAHTVYSLMYSNTKYSNTSRFTKGEGRTRYLRLDKLSNGWKDITEIELPAYNKLIQKQINDRPVRYYNKLSGFVLMNDKQFRIIDKLKEDALMAKNDPRTIRDGKICTDTPHSYIITIMYRLGVDIGYDIDNTTPIDKIKKFLDTKGILKSTVNPTEEELRYYYTWYIKNNYTRIEMCDIVRDRMRELNILDEQ